MMFRSLCRKTFALENVKSLTAMQPQVSLFWGSCADASIFNENGRKK
jgi:hypothetical protein